MPQLRVAPLAVPSDTLPAVPAAARPVDPSVAPSPSPPAALVQRARRMPKVLLHEHLDGGLRPGTLLDLLRQRALDPPAGDVPALAAWFEARAHAGSLQEYLRGFALTVAAMATPAALERVAFEAAEDARLDGCVLAEFRVAPLLFESHGVPGEAAVEALLAGLARSALPTGLIVCAMRDHGDAAIERSAALALRYRAGGVVGFDLAGPEAGWPATRHARQLDRVRDGGLALTLHAGEADHGDRVLEAARLGAQRIGHGVQLAGLIEDAAGAAILDELRTRGVHFEVCPTSNVHTGAARSLATHPIRSLLRAGLSVSFHTDNRLISCIDLSTEAANLLHHAGVTWTELLHMEMAAARASFLPQSARAQAGAALADWATAEHLRP